MNEDKITSPHADLQAVLSKLGRLSPRRRVAPAFPNRDVAERIVAVAVSNADHAATLTPVWEIDHDDLTESEIVAWTVVARAN